MTPLNLGDQVQHIGNRKIGVIKAFNQSNRSFVTVWFDENGTDTGQYSVTTLRKVNQ